jgi:hypothetical protein
MVQPMSWKLDDGEITIERIVHEMNQAPKRSGKRTILNDWRSKLQQEPNHLQAYQIDMIMREVQRRLKSDAK